MRFQQLSLTGAFLIEPEQRSDERGFFARAWCRREFEGQGIRHDWPQCNISFNKRRGTLRGLHYQEPPCGEAKLIRCTMGAIFDVIVDLRRGSPTYGSWYAVELTAENRRMIYAPEGFAHGFQTLADNAEVFYQMGAFHNPDAARGIRWDDPILAINWPACPERIISASDRSLQGFLPCSAS